MDAETVDPGRTPFPPPPSPDEVVRRIYQAFALRDLSRLAGMLEPDFAWLGGQSSPDVTGREETLSWLEDVIAASNGTITVRLQQTYVHGGGCVVTFHETKQPKTELRIACVLWNVNDGQAQRATTLSPAPSGR